MGKVLIELTTQIVGLYYAAELSKNGSDQCKKSAEQVSRAYETVLLHSIEAKRIFDLDREISKKFGFVCIFSTVDEMRNRAVSMAKIQFESQAPTGEKK